MGRAHDTRRCAKGPVAEAERDASQHAVGGIAQFFFFSLYLFINSTFFFTLCLDQWTQHDHINKTKRCRAGNNFKREGQTRSKSYGTWGQRMKRPRKNNNRKIPPNTSPAKMHAVFFLETPRGAPSALFLFCKTPRERYFGIVLWNAPGGVYSVPYGMHGSPRWFSW